MFFFCFAVLTASIRPEKRLQAVVDTLDDLLKTIQQEETDEQKNYDCFMQWCSSETATKEQEIKEQELTLEDLKVAGEEDQAFIAKASAVVEDNKEQIKEITDALEQADAIRSTEQQQWTTDKEINSTSVRMLDKSIEIAQRANDVGFLQVKQQLNAPGESSFVLGVFKSLKTNMVRNQESADAAEAKKQALYEKLVANKRALLANLQEETEQKTIKLAEAKQKLTQTQNDIKTTTTENAEARRYLEETNTACAEKEKEWQIRKADRAQEKTAIEEAIAFLNITFQEEQKKAEEANQAEDGSEDPSDAPPPDFLQEKKSFLNLASINLDSADFNLSQLSTEIDQSSRSDNFRGVKKKIIELVTALQREDAEEKKKKVRCETTATKHEAELEDRTDKMELLTALIERKKQMIEVLSGGIDEIKTLMADTKKQNEDMEKLRKEERKVFQTGTQERALALKVVKQAKVVLQKFYDSKDATAAALVQKQHQDAPKPETWDKKSSRRSSESNVVLAMLEKIQEDIQREQRASETAEKEAQAEFEKHQNNAAKEFDLRMEEITEKSARRAKTSVQLETSKEDEGALADELGAVNSKIQALEEDCGEFLHSYDDRSKARAFEISQLKDAHDIFSGSNIAVRTNV